MDQFEVEKQDCSDPLIDGGVRLDVGILEHAANALGVHFNDKVLDTNEVEAEGAKGSEQSIELELSL